MYYKPCDSSKLITICIKYTMTCNIKNDVLIIFTTKGDPVRRCLYDKNRIMPDDAPPNTVFKCKLYTYLKYIDVKTISRWYYERSERWKQWQITVSICHSLRCTSITDRSISRFGLVVLELRQQPDTLNLQQRPPRQSQVSPLK